MIVVWAVLSFSLSSNSRKNYVSNFKRMKTIRKWFLKSQIFPVIAFLLPFFRNRYGWEKWKLREKDRFREKWKDKNLESMKKQLELIFLRSYWFNLKLGGPSDKSIEFKMKVTTMITNNSSILKMTSPSLIYYINRNFLIYPIFLKHYWRKLIKLF